MRRATRALERLAEYASVRCGAGHDGERYFWIRSHKR